MSTKRRKQNRGQTSMDSAHATVVELVNVRPTPGLQVFWLPLKTLPTVRTVRAAQGHTVMVTGRVQHGCVAVEQWGGRIFRVDAQDLYAAVAVEDGRITKALLGAHQEWRIGRRYRLGLSLDGFPEAKFENPQVSLRPRESDGLTLVEILRAKDGDLAFVYEHEQGRLVMPAALAFCALSEARAA